MNSESWINGLVQETREFFALLTPGGFLLLLFLTLVAMLVGRVLRHGVHVLWRLGLDPGRRLAPLGTVVQLVLFTLIAFGVLRLLVRTAPVGTFIVLVATIPLLVVLVQRPARNALSGLTILFRRSFLEGDRIMLERGQGGVVRQIGLTSTVARTDAGGKLIIPNSRVQDLVLEVDRRQSGVPLVLQFPTAGRPSVEVLILVKRIGMLSPYRAGDSLVAVEFNQATSELEVTIRLPRAHCRDAARRELWTKITRCLEPSS